MRFVYPWILAVLLLLPLVGLLGFWMLNLGGRRLSGFVSPDMQARLAPPRRQGLVAVQVALMLAGLALLALAAARPQWGRAEVRVESRGRNLLIALDVSRSMLAADVHPNRLERAKADILDLLEELRGDRAGLLVFRGKANLLCPLTTDRAFLRQALDGATIDAAPRGETDLADAINKSLDALQSAFDQNNAILLITDGEDLAGRALAAAGRAAARGVPIFAVGIGDPQGSAVPAADGQGMLQFQGRPVMTRMEEGTLEAIARASGGAYIPLATAGTASTTLGAIYRQHLTRVAAREFEEQLERRYIERYQLFLIPAVLLLLATAMLSRGRLAGGSRRPARPVPPPVPAAGLGALLALLVFAGLPAASVAAGAVAADAAASTNAPAAPPGREGARLAQKFYRRGLYAEAAEAYLAAASGVDAAEANRYRYNAALAWFKAGDLEQAARTIHPQTMLAGQDGAAELYGAARIRAAGGQLAATNAAVRAKALEQASGGFQQALRAVPEDARRQRNLDRALKGLPAAREEAHIERVLAAHGQTPPESLLARMRDEQRAVLAAAPAGFTNQHAETMIRDLEALGARVRANGDLWIPLKRALVESNAITNEQQRAMVAERIEQTRDGMKRGARRLDDLAGEGVADVAQAEQTIYAFWQMLAAPPGLVAEAIQAQTNAWAKPDTPRVAHRPDQPDAGRLTELFRDRFGPWADQVQQQAQADTNAPSLSPEDRAEIERLADETVQLHTRIAQAMPSGEPRPADAQFQALKNLIRIQELLPKDKSGQQSQPQPQPNPQQEPQEQNPPEQPPESPPEENEEPQEPQPEEKPDEPPPDVQEVLRRALEREKEHEADKRRQMREFPMAPNARDW